MRKIRAGGDGIRDADQELIYGINIRNSVRAQEISIGTSATAIPTTALDKRMSLVIMNISSNIVYLGASDVTTAQGFPVYPRGVLLLSCEDKANVYGIAGSSSNIRILEGA